MSTSTQPNDGGSYMAPDPRTRAQRMMRRLFPRTAAPLLIEEPAFSTSTTVFLDWRDRLRVLASGCLRLEYRHFTDVEVKRVASTCTCTCYVESPMERP